MSIETNGQTKKLENRLFSLVKGLGREQSSKTENLHRITTPVELNTIGEKMWPHTRSFSKVPGGSLDFHPHPAVMKLLLPYPGWHHRRTSQEPVLSS